MKTKKTENNKGFALIAAMLYTLLITAFLAAFYIIAIGGYQQAQRTTDSLRAYYIADAGLSKAFLELKAVTGALPTSQSLYIPPTSYSVGPGNLSGSYTVSFADDGASWRTYTITSVGTFGIAAKTLTLKVKLVSIARWNYLSNSEITSKWGTLWWVTSMYSEGPVHTNGQFNIMGSPIFNGPVSQSAATINYGQGGPPKDNPDFQGGLSLGASNIFFPTNEILNNVQTAAQTGGLSLNAKDPKNPSTTVIQLLSDGTMKVTNTKLGWNQKSMAIPANGALYVQDENVEVKGTLKGQLTIASNKDVLISGSILYNTDPMLHDADPVHNPASTDMLGLVSNNNVSVKEGVTGALRIDAYIVALTQSFNLQCYLNNHSAGGNQGDMVQYGGLTNNTCGPTGVMDSSGRITDGYNQLQYYDARFQDTAPPWFPAARESNNGRYIYVKTSFTES